MQPLQRLTLDKNIRLESRKIAHRATGCDHDAHTVKCDLLTREIEHLAISVKSANLKWLSARHKLIDNAMRKLNARD
jgi:hypothetical protein